ncbi:hypothetical protein [Actinoplanes derwentensis]|uniref:hypothetical protein n=1 Tax=Actinoplanes derwentensis TaxID=113562 RepID=UPI0018D43533|nr:hypothetical protein [Actinoplanes derwentensis]
MVSVCQLTELEIYFSSRSEEHLEKLKATIREHFVDLLLAATAELNRMTILHYDRDFETLLRSPGSRFAGLRSRGQCPDR